MVAVTRLFAFALFAAALSLSVPAVAEEQAPTDPQTEAPRADFAAWLAEFRNEAITAGIAPGTFDRALKGVEPDETVIALDRRQHLGKLVFAHYIARLASPTRRKAVRTHLTENSALLNEIGKEYGVPARFIVALWCIESDFGAAPGDFPVIPSLATLAYEGRRASLFKRELIAALQIVERYGVDPADMRGSWAGAMGQSQFMPSTYLAYAISYKGDGKPDIWTRRADVFASIANYLSHVGWNAAANWGRFVRAPAGISPDLIGAGIVKSVKEWSRLGVRGGDGGPLPASDLDASLLMPDGDKGPALLIYDNFRAIMKWNNSTAFAAAVGLLADSDESR